MSVSRRTFLCAPAAALAPHTLAGRSFELSTAVSGDAVWLDRLHLLLEGRTDNLLFERPPSVLHRSGTALRVGQTWHGARPGPDFRVRREGSSMRVEGLLLGPAEGPLVREEWNLRLEENRFHWEIEREYLRDTEVSADRFPALVLRTDRKESDIPGFLDEGMRLDGVRGFPLGEDWWEVVSSNTRQRLHLAPGQFQLESALAFGEFSYAKPPTDGTPVANSIGGRPAPGRHARGERQRQRWSLTLGRFAGVAPLELELPDGALAATTAGFGAVHNQWMGWMFGNNPASVTCLHEMGWFPMIQGAFPYHEAVHRAMGKQLRFLARTGVDAQGYVEPRWSSKGYYRVPWGNLMDQIPHFLLAVYHHAVNTGDRAFTAEVMPVVDRVAAWLAALDADGDGVFEVPRTSGLANGAHDCSNWYDIIKFGHKDAYVNAWSISALDGVAELKAWMGDEAGGARFRAAASRARAGFNKMFWDPERGFYMDWIDREEKMPGSGRRYFYTDHNLLAIVNGTASGQQAGRIVANLDRRYQELAAECGVKREAIWATPCNMIPVTQLGDLVDFGKLGNQKEFPNYENGCSFFHTTGLEIAARAAAGNPDEAYRTFERVMEGYRKTRFWGAALNWKSGQLTSEPLNDSLLILWGMLRGCFGAAAGLNGVRLAEAAPRAMEGGRTSFSHQGKSVSVTVKGGRPRL